MDSAPEVLAQKVGSAIEGAGEVQALVLTTFNLDVAYLEDMILPAFFPQLGEGPADEPAWLLMQHLEETRIPISVLYDAHQLLGAEQTPSSGHRIRKNMRWQAHPIRTQGGCFHPKVFLALTQHESGSKLVVGCSSANLTRSGWSSNLEVCVIEVIDLQRPEQEALLGDVCSLVDWLISKTVVSDGQTLSHSEALKQIQAATHSARSLSPDRSLHRKRGRQYHPRLWHSGRGGNDTTNEGLYGWLVEQVFRRDLFDKDEPWRLEIISPYYAEKPVQLVKKLGKAWSQDRGKPCGRAIDSACEPMSDQSSDQSVPDERIVRGAQSERSLKGSQDPRILCYLPMCREQGSSSGSYIDLTSAVIEQWEHDGLIQWGSLPPKRLESKIADPDGNRLPRYVHAKIYRFWNRDTEVFVVGSANATAQGLAERHGGLPINDEVCMVFCRQAPEGTPFSAWLRPLSEPVDPDQCRPTKSSPEDQMPTESMPDVRVTFDWSSCDLEATWRGATAATVSPETWITVSVAGDTEVQLSSETPSVVRRLSEESARRVLDNPVARVVRQRSKEGWSESIESGLEWYVLLEEVNLECRPAVPMMDRGIDALLQSWQLSADERLTDWLKRDGSNNVDGEESNLDGESYSDAPEIEQSDRLYEFHLAVSHFEKEVRKQVEDCEKIWQTDGAAIRRKTSESQSRWDRQTMTADFAKTSAYTRLFGRGAMSVHYFAEQLMRAGQNESSTRIDPVEIYVGLLYLKDLMNRLAKDLSRFDLSSHRRSLSRHLGKYIRQAERELRKELNEEANGSREKQDQVDPLIEWAKTHFLQRPGSTQSERKAIQA